MRSFSIELNGHRYRGTWQPIGTDAVKVSSDYGAMTAPRNGRDPAEVARQVLAGIVAHPTAYA